MVNGQKQGGNVASYFCRPDGTVIHAVAGPVGADDFLREARWAVEADKLADTHADDDPARYRAALRLAHLARLNDDSDVRLPTNLLPRVTGSFPPRSRVLRFPPVERAGNAAKVHALLAAYPAPKLSDLYPIVWEDVLNEKVSLAPVKVVKN